MTHTTEPLGAFPVLWNPLLLLSVASTVRSQGTISLALCQSWQPALEHRDRPRDYTWAYYSTRLHIQIRLNSLGTHGNLRRDGKEACWVGAGAVEEAAMALKIYYRYFPKVKKPHNHRNSGNQVRAVNLKNEIEFASDMIIPFNTLRIICCKNFFFLNPS